MKEFMHMSKRLLAMLLALVLLFGSTTTAMAHAEGEEEDGTDYSETAYSIQIYNEKEPNKNGTLTYTVTNHEDGTVSEIYDLNDNSVVAYEGDTITLYPAAKDGYVLSSIGYVKEERKEAAFNIKVPTAQADGSYTFTMPANNIYVGAAFYAKDDYYILKESGTSNSIANIDSLHVLELGLNEAWLHENTEEVSVDMHLDSRILEFEELSGKKLTFRMEIREVGDNGYNLKGSKEYTIDELQALVKSNQYGEPVVDEKGRTYYYVKDVAIPVDVDKDLTYTEDGEYEIYCTAMFTLEGWTNAIGAPYYRWGYSGGDRAYILENDTPIPASMVYFYNLEPETYHGALAAEAVAQVEKEMGIDIDVRYFTSENMTECIGYLAEWPGYESRGELGVDREPSTKTYAKKIILYCSLPSMVRDKLGDYIRETGIASSGALSSKLTAYGAAKTFEEFYAKQETEASVFTAALSLSLLTYETYTVVTEEKYGTHELWEEFKTTYDECLAIINNTAELEEEEYVNARMKLLDVYLRIMGKTYLDIDFKFVIEEYDDDNYKVSVDQRDFPADLVVTYRWHDASKEAYLIIPKNQLYKVNCTISSVDAECPYYGFKQIGLSAPADLEYKVTVADNSVSVNFTKLKSLVNTPEPITYIAELYQNGVLLSSLSNETADALTFTNLVNGEYSVRIYATNIVGRTTYMTETVTVNVEKEPVVDEENKDDNQPEEETTVLDKAIVKSVVNKAAGVKITWNKVDGATGYYVLRRTKKGDWKKIATIKKGKTTSYTDEKVKSKNGTKYYYTVQAYSSSGEAKYNVKGVGIVRLTRMSISSLKNTAKKKMTVKWKKNVKATGYQISYSTSSKFTKKTTNTVKITKKNTVSKVISKLKKGKKYYVKIRSYKKSGNTVYYSTWSKVKRLKVLK